MNPAPPSTRNTHSRELLVALLMVAWVMVVWGFLIVGSIAKSSGEREFPALAHTSLPAYFFTAATFLVAPVIGGFSAFRFVRGASRTGFPVIIGWLLLVLFASVFSFSCMVCWLDYHRYAGA